MNTNTAEALLEKQERGSYLFRFSSKYKDGFLAFSVKKTEVEHFTLQWDVNRQVFVFNGKFHQTLAQFVLDNANTLVIPFERSRPKKSSKKSYSDAAQLQKEPVF